MAATSLAQPSWLALAATLSAMASAQVPPKHVGGGSGGGGHAGRSGKS